MPANPRISVVIISRNEGGELKRTIENFQKTLPSDSEIVVVDDGSIDGSTRFLTRRGGAVKLIKAKGLGVARARNTGGGATTGDIIVFADAHLRLPPEWWKPMAAALENPRVGAVAPVIRGTVRRHLEGYGLTFRDSAMEVRWIHKAPAKPAEAPILPGCTLAMRRDVFQRPCGGWDNGLLQRGNVDNEISVRLWLLGYKLLVVPDVVVKHRFRKSSPYPVAWPQYVHNRLRLAFSLFSEERLGRVVASLRAYPGFGAALRRVMESDIAERRAQLLSLRKRTDDWYFDRFRLKW